MTVRPAKTPISLGIRYSSSDLAEIEIVLNDDLGKLKEWANKKTEVMLISNIFHDYDPRPIYDDTLLNIVETHKHLGIRLSTNNKWTKYMDSIIDPASKQVLYLRKLKYQLSKHTLDRLYCIYLRPLLEYGSEIWDG